MLALLSLCARLRRSGSRRAAPTQRSLLATWAALALATSPSLLLGQDPAVEFRTDIQPILETYCLTCH